MQDIDEIQSLLDAVNAKLAATFQSDGVWTREIKDQLIKYGEVSRGYLGVTVQDLSKDLVEYFGLKDTDGVLVADTTKGSPADKAGLKKGDVIVSLNGKEIENVGQLCRVDCYAEFTICELR